MRGLPESAHARSALPVQLRRPAVGAINPAGSSSSARTGPAPALALNQPRSPARVTREGTCASHSQNRVLGVWAEPQNRRPRKLRKAPATHTPQRSRLRGRDAWGATTERGV